MISFITRVFITDVSADDNWFKSFREFFEGFKNFISSLKNLLQVVFPVFTNEEIALVITFLVIFIGLLIYLLGRKVTF